jgi:hypothetical protein
MSTIADAVSTLSTSDHDTITRRRRFAQIPEDLITDGRLSDRAVRLWCRLDRYAGRDGRAFPKIATLAADIGCSTASVDRALAELVHAGWITRERAWPGGPCRTTLLDEPITPAKEGDPHLTGDATSPHGRRDPHLTGDVTLTSRVTRQRKESQRRRAKEGGGDVVSDPTSAREDRDTPPDAHSTPTAPPGSHVEGTPPGPDIPPARCPEHIDAQGDVPPCRACADARRAHDAAVTAHERARAARTARIDRDRHTVLQWQMLADERAAYRPTKGHLRRLVRQHRADAGSQALADAAKIV